MAHTARARAVAAGHCVVPWGVLQRSLDAHIRAVRRGERFSVVQMPQGWAHLSLERRAVLVQKALRHAIKK